MSGEAAPAPASPPPPPPLPPRPKSGIRIALEFTGVPPSWLDKRPRLPSRNWLIFLSVTSSIAGAYIYDRRQCKQIRQAYIDKVKHLAEVPLGSHDLPRKVTVYGARWPGDEDFDRSMRYFRKYVKPVLVAAAVDYDMVRGKKLGDIAERIADEVQARRRIAAGLDPVPENVVPVPINFSPEEKRRRELGGGIVVVGRNTFKEFMDGLHRGWTGSLRKLDREEQLAQVLELDGRFDELDDGSDAGLGVGLEDAEPLPMPVGSGIYSPFQQALRAPPPRAPRDDAVPDTIDVPPAAVPELPPLLLVSFTNYIGLSLIPLMVWDVFTERNKVRAGAEAGYRLVMGHTRPFRAPEPGTSASTEFVAESDAPAPAATSPPANGPAPATNSDLDFDRDVERYYSSGAKKRPKEIADARAEFYAALPEKLATARALARRTREPTKEERNFPPPTEVELRADRMAREKRWRSDDRGWGMVRTETPVAWDERFRDAFKVFDDPPEGHGGAQNA